MVTRARKQQDEEASIPASVQPPAPSYGGHGGLDAGFVWQQLSEIQKTLGAIDAKLDQHKYLELLAKAGGSVLLPFGIDPQVLMEWTLKGGIQLPLDTWNKAF